MPLAQAAIAPETDPDERVYPLTRHAGEAIVARRAGQPISLGEFLGDVAALAARLPDHADILNLCADRYRFMVGFAAALCRRQISLLPPGDAPGILQAVAADYPDLYALTDRPVALPFPQFAFPAELEPRICADIPALPGAQPALILFTSGSTGRPVPVPKTWGVLVRSALAAGTRLGISRLAGASIIGTVPHQHSYGLESMILLSLQHGLALDAGAPLYAADIAATLAAAPRPRILVTTPVHLQALVAEPGGMPPVDLILSATAPLPAPLAAQAEACFAAPLTEIYGCTEAGQIATRRTRRETDWQCLDGVRLQTFAGQTQASGEAVQGMALVQDVIEPIGPGRFRLAGRAADLVDVAGKRISLAHLNQLLLSIEGVRDGVFLMPEPDGRKVLRLAALAVAPGLRPAEIMRGLRMRMDAAFLPRPLVLTDALPRNALGKLPRAALLEMLRKKAVAF